MQKGKRVFISQSDCLHLGPGSISVDKIPSRIPDVHASASALGWREDNCPNSTDVEDSNVETTGSRGQCLEY